MNYHEIKKEQWAEFYESTEYVTSTDVNFIMGHHQLEVPKNKLILDIGVGYGNFVRTLSKTNTMIGVDVSLESLEGVKSVCKSIHLSNDISKIEKVDLAMSSLVFQHNHEYEVTRIINDVNLKDDGLFSFQFATLNDGRSKLTSLLVRDINRSMLYFYSLEKMRVIVERTNKKIVKEIGPIWFSEPFNFEWHIFHVKNK